MSFGPRPRPGAENLIGTSVSYNYGPSSPCRRDSTSSNTTNDWLKVAGEQEDEMKPTISEGQAATGSSKLSKHSQNDDAPQRVSQSGQRPLSYQEKTYNARQREMAADKERLQAASRFTEWALAQPTIPEEDRYRPDGWVYISKKKQGQGDKKSNSSEQC